MATTGGDLAGGFFTTTPAGTADFEAADTDDRHGAPLNGEEKGKLDNGALEQIAEVLRDRFRICLGSSLPRTAVWKDAALRGWVEGCCDDVADRHHTTGRERRRP